MVRIAIVLWVMVSMAACTAQRAVTRPSAGTVAHHVDVGEVVRIWARNGKVYEMRVTQVGDGYLRGINRKLDKRYRIPFSEIERLEFTRFSLGKTLGASLITMAIASALFAYFFGKALEDSH